MGMGVCMGMGMGVCMGMGMVRVWGMCMGMDMAYVGIYRTSIRTYQCI